MNIALIVEIHSGGVHTRESVEMTKVIVNEQDLNASSQDQRRRAGENQKSIHHPYFQNRLLQNH